MQDLIFLADKNPQKDVMKYMRWEDSVETRFSRAALRDFPPPVPPSARPPM
jgi:hypothetical protein